MRKCDHDAHVARDRSEETFRAWWRFLEILGEVDAYGGAEWTRIHGAWVDAGRPNDGIIPFIRSHVVTGYSGA